eukprot:3239454-Pleurochrysis_carterae.AAC.2
MIFRTLALPFWARNGEGRNAHAEPPSRCMSGLDVCAQSSMRIVKPRARPLMSPKEQVASALLQGTITAAAACSRARSRLSLSKYVRHRCRIGPVAPAFRSTFCAPEIADAAALTCASHFFVVPMHCHARA